MCSHQKQTAKASTIEKLQNCKCDKCCRVADRALEAQNAQVMSDNQNYDGRLKRKGGEANGQKSDKCPKDVPMSSSLRPSIFKKWMFEGELLRVGFQKCVSRSSGEHILVKIRQNATRDNSFANKSVYSYQEQPAKGTSHQKLQNCKCAKCCRFVGRLPVQKLHVLPRIFQIRMGD